MTGEPLVSGSKVITRPWGLKSNELTFRKALDEAWSAGSARAWETDGSAEGHAGGLKVTIAPGLVRRESG